MIVTFFNRNTVALYPAILVMSLILWWWAVPLVNTNEGLQIHLAWFNPIGWSNGLSVSLFWLLAAVILIWIKGFSDHCGLLPAKSFLPMLVGSSMLALFPHWMSFNEIIIALGLVFWATDQLRKLHNSVDGRKASFNAGLLIGLAGMIYLYAYWYLLVLVIGLVLFRPMIWREWILGLTGAALPLLYLTGLAYIFEWQTYQVGSNALLRKAINPAHLYWVIAAVSLLSLLAIKHILALKSTTKLVSNGYTLLSVIALVSVGIAIVDRTAVSILIGVLPVLSISVAAVLGEARRKGLVNVMAWLFVLGIVGFQLHWYLA